MKQSKIFIYGKHALEEALVNRKQSVRKIFLSPSLDDAKFRAFVKNSGVPVSDLKGNDLKDFAGGGAHQGVIAQISLEGLMIPFKEFLKNLKITDDTSLVLCAELEDPHNVGAIIRSSAGFGASGVLIPEHNQAPVTGAVVKVSAGMAFRIPLVQIGNINQAVRDLKDAGFEIYGLAGEEGSESLNDQKFDAPAVFIVGNEGSGLRLKTREYCDKLIAIPMNPKCESLNASVSTAVALYAWSVKHPGAVGSK